MCMKITISTCFAAALTCLALTGCANDATIARRSVTTIRTDPRPPEDTNLIPPPVPAPESTAVIRHERRTVDDE